MILVGIFLAIASYLIFNMAASTVYLMCSKKHNSSFKNLALLFLFNMITIIFYYPISAFILNLATKAGMDPIAYIAFPLDIGWFIVPVLGGIVGLRIYRLGYKKIIIYYLSLVIISLFCSLQTKSAERRILPSTAMDIHEFQEFRGWGFTHLLKAKITKDEFDKIRDEFGYVHVKSDFLFPGLSTPDDDWWDPTDITTIDDTYYDPTCGETKTRIIRYKKGYFYYFYRLSID